MGKISEASLWKLLNPPPGGTARKVGGMKATSDTRTATAIRKKDDGFWYYETEEVPIEVWPNRFLELPAEKGFVIWMGLEVKTKELEWKNKQLAFTLEPYSLNWYGNGPLRQAAKKSREALTRALRKAQRKTGDWSAALEALSYDPFETNRKWLTARLKNPMRLQWENLEPLGDQFAFGRSPNYTYGAKGCEKPPTWYFGVCEDFHQAQQDLKTELLGHPKLAADLPMEPAHLFDPALAASIRQALAGRAGGNRPNRIAFQVKRIFQKHMDAAAKRSGAAPR